MVCFWLEVTIEQATNVCSTKLIIPMLRDILDCIDML